MKRLTPLGHGYFCAFNTISTKEYGIVCPLIKIQKMIKNNPQQKLQGTFISVF